jgi:hypothetical protein
MSINVNIKFNEEDELYCVECKERILFGEKHLVILEESLDGEVEKRPVHFECIQETFEDDEFPTIL